MLQLTRFGGHLILGRDVLEEGGRDGPSVEVSVGVPSGGGVSTAIWVSSLVAIGGPRWWPREVFGLGVTSCGSVGESVAV
jgi:hypothetical protein